MSADATLDAERRVARMVASLSGGEAGAAASAPTEKPAALVQVRNLTRIFDVSKPWLNRVIERDEKKFLK